MEIVPVTLEDPEVKLIPISLEHVDGLYKAAQSTEIWPYMPYPLNSIEKVRFYIDECLEKQRKGTELVFTIFDKRTNEIVGSTRYLDILPKNRGLEIGWTWLNPTVWRSAINTKCKYLLLTHAFDSMGCIRVQLKTDSRNIRSQKAIERLGAVLEGTLRNHRILSDGYFRDTVYFSIIDKEWPTIKERLEKLLGN